ncbi:hypothetical protein [Natronomonas sp. CBA1123]|uniref:hypothetical protein n=1 Tax=Natronomonas sp. CBA1123 TaxID=2668070 RepID=UPI0018D21B59|nr:hypothetical protein [Natronomonas sp. CBA1123]
MSSNTFQRGDVFWAPDPFRQNANPRLWLVLAADSLPYAGEEYICAALTTSNLPENYEIGTDWIRGRDPSKTSYCSPWVVATIKHQAVANPQGEVTTAFADRMIDECTAYLDS